MSMVPKTFFFWGGGGGRGGGGSREGKMDTSLFKNALESHKLLFIYIFFSYFGKNNHVRQVPKMIIN